MLAPLAAVLLFLAAIIAAFGYLRLEEVEREQEAVKRDLEYAQQRLRLRLLERQEQLMRLARDISNKEVDPEEFMGRAETLVAQYPELQAVTWIDEQAQDHREPGTRPAWRPQAPGSPARSSRRGDTEGSYSLGARPPATGLLAARRGYGHAASASIAHAADRSRPVLRRDAWASIRSTACCAMAYRPKSRPSTRWRCWTAKNAVLAGRSIPVRQNTFGLLPWATHVNEDEVPVSPVGNGLILRGQAYRTSLGVIGSGLFWLVVRPERDDRLDADRQLAPHAPAHADPAARWWPKPPSAAPWKTPCSTGMRALDMQGRITYVNPAFCQMTGWSEAELVGQHRALPLLARRTITTCSGHGCSEELTGQIPPSGIQVRVKRKDGSLFDARLYVSPLIDAVGKQTGWMTSMTDITEPNRIREQLSASHERFTTVLEALDASVSVAPLGSEELLFANKLYRLWFGTQAAGPPATGRAGRHARTTPDRRRRWTTWTAWPACPPAT